MEQLLRPLESLKRSETGMLVRKRAAEFRAKGVQSEDEIFKELCFCLLTANYSAYGGIRIQQAVGAGFIILPRPALARRLRSLGYRFPDTRARYICEARRHRAVLKQKLASLPPSHARAWLAENVLGLGYKESSHFLRNIGFTDLAIIDFHILGLLARHGIIKKPGSKSLSKNRYLEIERKLAQLAAKAGLTLAELDLYLWYMETGRVLK
jgi:N-glycosylase/DNA lyase